MEGVLLDESDRVLDRAHRQRANLRAVRDPASVAAGEAADLDPGVRKVALPVASEEQDPAHRGYPAPLVAGHEAQGLEVSLGELAQARERLGSRSEVQRFRVEARHRLLIVGFTAAESPEFLDELAVGPAVGRPHSNVNTGLHAIPPEIMRAAGAGVDLHSDDLSAAPRQDLDLRHEPRGNLIADEVGEPLLHVERINDAADVGRSVFHPTSRVPPAVFAKATTVLRAPSEPERSRLNSRVFPSARLSSSMRSMLTH
jgi:hypothetical protein